MYGKWIVWGYQKSKRNRISYGTGIKRDQALGNSGSWLTLPNYLIPRLDRGATQVRSAIWGFLTMPIADKHTETGVQHNANID